MNEKILEALRGSLERTEAKRRESIRWSPAWATLFCKEEDLKLAIAAQEAIIEGAKE